MIEKLMTFMVAFLIILASVVILLSCLVGVYNLVIWWLA